MSTILSDKQGLDSHYDDDTILTVQAQTRIQMAR